jgi:hypothetical protein
MPTSYKLQSRAKTQEPRDIKENPVTQQDIFLAKLKQNKTTRRQAEKATREYEKQAET